MHARAKHDKGQMTETQTMPPRLAAVVYSLSGMAKSKVPRAEGRCKLQSDCKYLPTHYLGT